MPPNHDDSSSRFQIVTCEGMPVAVLRDEVDDDATEISALDLEGLTLGYTADEPWHLSMGPEAAHRVFGSNKGFVGHGAKEGHGITRQGVDLVGLAPPPREPAPVGARRAVVAVLDTVVAPHDWIGDGRGEDAFWRDARHLTPPWDPRDSAGSPLPVPEDVGDATTTHAGHGTFITGIVRLLAPGARVISLPVMDHTGVVDQALLESALTWLLDRARCAADEGRHDLAVDVVNLSFGRYLTLGQQVPDEDAVRGLLDSLGRLGVRVVASAGNRGTSREVVPAAWSGTDTDEHVALQSVGALDPDDGAAPYSNHGPWVSVGARGTALVSCLPLFEEVRWPPDGVSDEELAMHEDPNLQRSTYGRWAGTSFAAALVSATVAERVMTPRIGGDLVATDRSEAIARARHAWGTFAPMPSVARPDAGERPDAGG